jgi:hypothetical protein
MGKKKGYKILIGNLKESDHPEDLGVDVRILLKWISRRRVGGCELNSSDTG